MQSRMFQFLKCDGASAVGSMVRLAFLMVIVSLSAPLAAETLRISLDGQLDADGLGVNSDYKNATFSGFFEIDLDNPKNDASSARFYDFTSWEIELVPAPPNPDDAPVIRFASDRETDDTGRILLERSSNLLNINIQEDNAPSSRRSLSVRFDPAFDFVSNTLFEELLTADNQSFTTEPAFVSGSLQFAVSQSPTSVLDSSLAISQSQDAATRYVDGIDGDDQGGGNGCAVLANPCATVQQGIDSAQAGDTIEIADAVYTETLTVDKALSMRGQSRAGTIIQAAPDRGTAGNRVISVVDDTAFELRDATVRHGRAGVSTGSSGNGGGMECLGGDLLLERVTFTDNDAEGLGAGLRSGDNVVVMIDVIFSENGNGATSNGGGAYLGENSVVTDVTLNDVVFENNLAAAGGGLELFNVQATIGGVFFVGNTSSGEGGGLFYEGSNSVVSSLDMSNTVFVGNNAGDSGGGMHTSTNDTPYELVNGLFSGNLADLGGGIYNQAGLEAGQRVLTNVTMSGNRATLRGGGIDRPFDMTLRNTIIWNNQDSSGTGTPEATVDDFFANSVIEVSNSLLQGYSANEFPNSSNNLDGTDPANNPLFRDAVNPGGAPSLAGNLRLQQDSPVRDQGNNTFVAGIDTDLDGAARIFGGTVDLGPYEGTDLIFADGFEDSPL
ncbi:MAG: hypothetical protein KGY53_12250 [Wenzhouxiangellaceae bacterium]|nr:hypothetical protein [Wenzhouxiangellaceae bacterium]